MNNTLTSGKARLYKTAFDLVTREYVSVQLESFTYADNGEPRATFIIRNGKEGQIIGKRGECDLVDFCL